MIRCAACTVVVVGLAVQVAVAQKPALVSREATVSATVEHIQRATRLLTFKTLDGIPHTVYAGPEIASFKDLQVGDSITATYRESTIVRVRALKAGAPEDPAASAAPTPVLAIAAIQSLNAVVTVEAIDPQGTLEYRTPDELTAVRVVSDRKLLEGLRPGQRVELTFTRERATSIERAAP